jgi:hypothetical protein
MQYYQSNDILNPEPSLISKLIVILYLIIIIMIVTLKKFTKGKNLNLYDNA